MLSFSVNIIKISYVYLQVSVLLSRSNSARTCLGFQALSPVLPAQINWDGFAWWTHLPARLHHISADFRIGGSVKWTQYQLIRLKLLWFAASYSHGLSCPGSTSKLGSKGLDWDWGQGFAFVFSWFKRWNQYNCQFSKLSQPQTNKAEKWQKDATIKTVAQSPFAYYTWNSHVKLSIQSVKHIDKKYKLSSQFNPGLFLFRAYIQIWVSFNH